MPTLSTAKKIEKDDNCLKFLMALFVETSGSYTKVDFEKLTKQFKAPYELKKFLLRKEIVKELKPTSNILFWKGDAPTDSMVSMLLDLIEREKRMKNANTQLNETHNALIAKKGLIPIAKEAVKEVKKRKVPSSELFNKYSNFLTALRLSITTGTLGNLTDFCKSYEIGGPTRNGLKQLGIINRQNVNRRKAEYVWAYPTNVTNELVHKLIDYTRNYNKSLITTMPVEMLNDNVATAIKEEKIVAKQSNNSDLETKKNVARLFAELGDFKEAEKILQTLVNKK